MLEIALKMILCLLIAALIGAIIGYILGRISKCDGNEERDNDADKPADNQTAHMLSLASQDMEVEKVDDEQETMHKIIDEENSTVEVESDSGLDLGIDEDKPLFLTSPRDGKADDLKEISGIGLKIEEVLNGLGIYHFDQISSWNEENLLWIDDNLLVFKGRAKRENWVGQAKILVAGGQTDFSKRVKNGDIDRY